MWVRFLKSKDDACSELETIMLEIQHLHARHHSQSGAFAPVFKFDSGYVFEVAITRRMCARLGVGVRDWIRILRLRESPRLLGFRLGLVGPDPRIIGNRGIRTLESQVVAGSEP
jgi:hypothetical protein